MNASETAMVLGILVAVIGYLLRSKDLSQEKEIEDLRKSNQLLFKKHDEDVAKLALFEKEVANLHYQKSELDLKFSSMEGTMKEGFVVLGSKFDKLADALMAHIIEGIQ